MALTRDLPYKHEIGDQIIHIDVDTGEHFGGVVTARKVFDGFNFYTVGLLNGKVVQNAPEWFTLSVAEMEVKIAEQWR